MATNLVSNIIKLNGRENYEEWAFAVENLLILESLQQCLVNDGDVNDDKAKAKIILTIEPSLYVHIKNETTTKALWTKLKRMFDKVGCVLYKWIGSLLLAGLPEKFSPMIMAIEHSGIDITADAIKSKLIDIEYESEGRSQSAFASKSWQNKKNKNVSAQMSDKSHVKCHKCKKYGHYKNQCENTAKQNSNAFSAVFLSGKFSRTDWYLDSGASMHMTANKHWLRNISNQNDVHEIVIANRSKIPVECCGDIKVTTVLKKTEYEILVTDVLYVPDLATNLLSVSQLMKRGNKVNFDKNCCYIYNQKNEMVATADLVEGVYKLNIKRVDCLLTSVSGSVWHRRFGHINSSDLDKMKDGAVIGMSYTDKSQVSKTNCIVCCEGKQTRLPFTHIGNRGEELLDIVHSDICGPMENKSIGGSKYFLLFVDDYSRMAFVYFLKTKDEVFTNFKTYKSLVENQIGKKIKVLRTDNGLEFCSKEFEKYLQNAGIIHQKTCSYTPEQNGLCERLNRTVVEKAVESVCCLMQVLTKSFGQKR